MSLNIIVLLLVVAVVFYRLYSLLGTRPDGFEKHEIDDKEAAKLFDLIVKETSKTINGEAEEVVEPTGIDAVFAKIPGFNKEKFINGAKKSFEMILNAFAKGDIDVLKMLLGKNLLKKFQDIIKKRQEEGVSAEAELIGFTKAEIKDAQISASKIAKITVDFISEQVNLLKNSKGDVVEGDANFIQSISDTWTFEKDITSPNPNWLLVSTKK